MSNAIEVFSAETNLELAASYDKWAARYDSDLTGQAGPEEAVLELKKYVQLDAKILDAGCGTGIVGELLSTHGYQHIEGLDLSKGMLEQAKQKNCYCALHQGALGETLNFIDDTFDAITVVGVFVMAHARSHSFDELIRITKSGGYLVFTLRPEFYENTDFKAKMAQLETQKRWTHISTTPPFHGRFKLHPEVYLQVWIYQVN